MSTGAASVPWAEILREELRDVGRVAGWLWRRGWAERNAGNLSVDVTQAVGRARTAGADASGDPEAWLIVTAGGARFRDIAEDPADGLLVLAASASEYRVAWDPAAGRRPPTSEMASHLAIHARQRAMGSRHRAVLHTHPTHLIALNHTPFGGTETDLNRSLWAMLPEVKVLVPEGVGVVPYLLPGSEALGAATVAALERHRVVLWDRHGCVVVERDLVEAFDLVDLLDKSARMNLLCRAAGYAPRGLTDEQIADLGRLADRLGIGP